MYETAAAFRQAIETRLNQRAREDGVEVNRLRRGLVFERIMARLEAAEPGAWVVKGGMVLEWRLGSRARGTRDLDLVLRGPAVSGAELRERLVELLAEDRGEDRFLFEVGQAQPLDVGFRFSMKASLAGKEFGAVRVDVAARGEELAATERLQLPRAVPAFELLSPPQVEVAATTQHFAEKLHALTRDYGEQLNTRIRDLIDLMLLIELDLVRPPDVLPVVRHVFERRGTHNVPQELPDPPAGWAEDFAQGAATASLRARTLQGPCPGFVPSGTRRSFAEAPRRPGIRSRAWAPRKSPFGEPTRPIADLRVCPQQPMPYLRPNALAPSPLSTRQTAAHSRRGPSTSAAGRCRSRGSCRSCSRCWP